MADDAPDALKLTIAGGMAEIDRSAWNALANPAEERYEPFLDWDFLEALEASGCATPSTGWTARHLLLTDRKDRLVGAAPLYVKSHSRGEFVFDHAWAEALHRVGVSYYPKLLCATPFTPVTGRRLLTASGAAADAVRAALASAIIEIADNARLSSVHINFLEEEPWLRLGDQGFLLRTDQQFHWRNDGYGNFEDFLGALASRKRKMIRKERAAAQSGLRIERLTGDSLQPLHWDAFFKFYMDTGSRKWGSPYLNRKFFSVLHERMADRVLLVLAYDGDRPIAGALNMIGSDALYGRYWGRTVDRPFLHFEVCYYQAIEFAIERGLKTVEAGAQGEHKLARGYVPSLTRSAHWIRHEGLRHAIADYLERERLAVADGLEMLSSMAPFRRGPLDADVAGPDNDEANGASFGGAVREDEEGF